MRKISKPLITVNQVFDDCIDNMRAGILKNAFIDNKDTLIEAEIDYNDKKSRNELSLIVQNEGINEIITVEELKKLYNDRMLKTDNGARVHYENLLLAAPAGKCPLCNTRPANTIDHYLPQSKYAKLSITPINLIPACSICNKEKLADCPTCKDDETLHPYYDNIEDDEWLKCNIINHSSIIFEYNVNHVSTWNALLYNRVKNHFLNFKLDLLFVSHAQEEFSLISESLKRLYINGGQDELKAHLTICYNESRKITTNSWRTALYECLSTDEDFLTNYFN